MAVELNDLRREFRAIRAEIMPRLLRTLQRGEFVGGSELDTFELAFARYCGARYAVGVASGTAALHLTLRALGIGDGDEVITTCLSFNATAEAIVHAGATPVFVDVDPRSLSLDAVEVAKAITPRTKAVLPVHLYGIPAPVEALVKLCASERILLIEDCAQAHGARVGRRHVGTFGVAGCYSFMAAKNLGAYGDAGLVLTDSLQVVRRLRMLRDHGRKSKHEHVVLGFCERLDNIQAAVLNVKLTHLDEWNARRESIAARYREGLDERRIRSVEIRRGTRPSNYVFSILVRQRERLREVLGEHGIQTGIYYPIPMHLQAAFRDLGYRRGSFPVAERAARDLLALPMHPFLTRHEVDRIIRLSNAHA